MFGAIPRDSLSGKGPTGIKQGLNFCSWSWLFSFAVPTTFVMNQCLKSCFSWFLFSFFFVWQIFWYFSPTFLRLSLSCCILFPLFISQVLELFLSIHSLNFPLPSEGSTPLSFCPLTSCPVWEDVCSSTCWQVQPGHRRAVPPEESAVACLNPCLGWVFVWKSRGMFLSILLFWLCLELHHIPVCKYTEIQCEKE